MPLRTPLYPAHLAANGKIVNFAGWDMPIHYGSQLDEHHLVRRDAGMFDVSHMLAVDVTGAGANAFLKRLLANNVDKLKEPGKALYSCMLDKNGCVIDDLITYFFASDFFRIVVNAGTADKDIAWMRKQAAAMPGGGNVTIESRRNLAMIAVQGPNARSKVWAALPGAQAVSEPLKYFQAVQWNDITLCRTGYTGEDGFELMLPATRAIAVWDALLAAGVKPAGLGARDTLRLEAGMNLYGQDMDEQVNPLESGLAWTVDLTTDREFVGRTALEFAQQRMLVGLVLRERGILRSHMKVFTALGEGETTSGSFAPTMNASIAFARVPVGVVAGDTVEVDIRGKLLKASVVKTPFVRNGKVLVEHCSLSTHSKEQNMSIPNDLKYTASHEWVRLESDGTVTIGITDHAQSALGDIVFLELPEVGRKVMASDELAVVESVKAASDIYAPVSGEVVAANQDAVDSPDSVNTTPYDTWLFKIKPDNAADVNALMDAKAYESAIQ